MDWVMDTWLNSWRTSKHAGVVRNCDYYEVTRTLIEDLMARGMKVVVAQHGDAFIGYAAYEEKDGKAVLHYLYVKDPFLRSGVEEQLLAALPSPGWFTFFNADLAKDRAWKHAPEIARRKSL
jgi:hypothetical protein